MAERMDNNEQAESKVTEGGGSDREVKGVESSKVSSDDLAVPAVEPQGDNVTVGGAADEVGEVEVVVSDAYVAENIAATNNGVDQAKNVHVITDKVVTDPNGPLGVQIPSEALTSVTLPIHALANGTPEQQLAAAADEE